MAKSSRRSYVPDEGDSETTDFFQSQERKGRKACRACTDFQSWVNTRKTVKNSESNEENKECPLDREELGRNTWGFLHTMAAYYPKKPTEQQQQSMLQLMNSFSQFYPCKICAADLRESLKKNPPDVKDRHTFSDWMCRRHNEVSRKLGKPEFDCSLVLERWRTGWKDGSCD